MSVFFTVLKVSALPVFLIVNAPNDPIKQSFGAYFGGVVNFASVLALQDTVYSLIE